MSDSVRGPTLLDLQDLVQVELTEVSTIITLKSFGGLCGALLTGLWLDRLQPSSSYLFLAVIYLFKSLSTLCLPFSPSLQVMQVVEFTYGFCHGGFHSVANPLLLRIWSGRDSSPILYAMHFLYGVGAMITPLLASPFLSTHSDTLNLQSSDNTTALAEQFSSADNLWTIKTLYPIIFSVMILPVPPYIHFFIQERRREQETSRDTLSDHTESNSECQNRKADNDASQVAALSRSKELLLILFTSFFYVAVSGVENSFRSFAAAFGVNCSLQLSRTEAANVLALYYLIFAVARAALIPISIFVSTTHILTVSILTLMVSTSLLSVMADTSLVYLQLGLALTGGGVASLFAAGILWAKSVINFNNKIGGVVCFSMRTSEQVFAYINGGLVDSQPVSFLYLMSGTASALCTCFIIMNVVARFCK